MDEIINKKAEIENYKRILNNYRGRWYDMGRRHLEALENELKELETNHRVTNIDGDALPLKQT